MNKYSAAPIAVKSSQPDINWTDFNFPPLLKLFHFNLSELPDSHKSVVRLLYISYLLILVGSVLNLLDSFIQAGMGYHRIRVLYGFLNIFIFNGIQMYVFYRGYRGLCADQSLLRRYKIMHLLAGILWLLVSILNELGFNGFVRSQMFDQEGKGGLVFLSVIESLCFLFSFLIMPVCIYRVHTFVFEGNLGSSENL